MEWSSHSAATVTLLPALQECSHSEHAGSKKKKTLLIEVSFSVRRMTSWGCVHHIWTHQQNSKHPAAYTVDVGNQPYKHWHLLSVYSCFSYTYTYAQEYTKHCNNGWAVVCVGECWRRRRLLQCCVCVPVETVIVGCTAWPCLACQELPMHRNPFLKNCTSHNPLLQD